MIAEAFSDSAGCVIVTFALLVQPFASVTVHVNDPAGRLLAVVPVCTGEEFQL